MNQCAAINISHFLTIIEPLTGDIPLISCTLCDSGCCELFNISRFSLFPSCGHFPRAGFKAVKFSTENKRINNAVGSEAKETRTTSEQEPWKWRMTQTAPRAFCIFVCICVCVA